MTFCHSPHPLDPKLNPYPTAPPVHGCYFFTLRLVTPFHKLKFGSGGLGGVAQCHQSMYWMLLFFAKHGTQDRCSKHALSLVCAAKKNIAQRSMSQVWNMHRTCIYRGSWVCCSVLRYASHWCWCWWMCHVTQSMHRICIEPRPHENSNVPFPSQSFLGGSYFGWIYIMISLLEWVWCDGMLHDSVNQHNDKRRCWAGIAK